MNSLSQVFSVVLKPKQRRERHFRKAPFTRWIVFLQPHYPPPRFAQPTLGAAVSGCRCGDGERRGRRHGGPRVVPCECDDPRTMKKQRWNFPGGKQHIAVVCGECVRGARTSRLPVAEVPRRRRGAAGGHVARLTGGRWFGNELVQRHRLQYSCETNVVVAMFKNTVRLKAESISV